MTAGFVGYYWLMSTNKNESCFGLLKVSVLKIELMWSSIILNFKKFEDFKSYLLLFNMY